MKVFFFERPTGSYCLPLLALHCMIALVVLVGQLVTASEPMNVEDILWDHLCSKVQAGRLDQINLKSMTFHYLKHSLIIFESNKKIYIPMTNIQPQGIKMSLNSVDWDKEELNVSVTKARNQGMLVDVQINAVYYLFWGETAWTVPLPLCEYSNYRIMKFRNCYWAKTRLGALIFTKDHIVTFDIYNPNEPRIMYGMYGIYPELAIIHDQVDMNQATGYIIHRDLYDQTNEMIIYDMKLNFKSMKMKLQKESDEKKKANAKYYYFDVNGNPNELVLVHRSKRNTLSSQRVQLFPQVPRGFRHEGNVYLFDTYRGCVFVVHNLTQPLNQKIENIVLKRSNIPYEKFFNCPGMIFDNLEEKLDPARCDITAQSNMDDKGRPGAPRTTPFFQIDNNSAIFSITLIVFLLLFVVCFVAIVIYYIFHHGKANEDLAKVKDQLAKRLSRNKRNSPVGSASSSGASTKQGTRQKSTVEVSNKKVDSEQSNKDSVSATTAD